MFDLRQNLLLVRDASHKSEILYHFFAACGKAFTLTGEVLKEILERQNDGKLYVNTYWGYSSKVTTEYWTLDDNNDLVIRTQVGPTCEASVPYRSLDSACEGFKTVNGLYISDSFRHTIKIHMKATGREFPEFIWFQNLNAADMRSMLLSFGLGPLRIENADKPELIKLHKQWLEDFDDRYKYTHNALGLSEDEKVPADYRPERIGDIGSRTRAENKAQGLMNNTLNELVVQARLKGDMPTTKRNYNKEQLTCMYATALIYAHDAKEKLEGLLDNSQFLVNFIYGWYPEYSWQKISEETTEYQQSLVRAALLYIQGEVQNKPAIYRIEHGMVKLNVAYTVREDEEVEEEDEDEDRHSLSGYSRDELIALVVKLDLEPEKKAITLEDVDLRNILSAFFDDQDEEEEEEEEEEHE